MMFHGTAEAFYGTVKPVYPFYPERDCKAIRAAMKGFGKLVLVKFVINFNETMSMLKISTF